MKRVCFANKTIVFIGYIFFCIIQTHFCFAGKEGTTAGVILKQEVGARQMGMGGAYTAIGNDINTLYYNPAGLANIVQTEVSTMYLDGLVDTVYGFVGYAQPLKNIYNSKGKGEKKSDYGSVGIGLVTLQGGEIEINYLDGTSEKRKAKEDYVLTLGYGREIKKVLIGLNFKTISSTLVEEYKDYAFALDIGGIYRLPYQGLSIGMVLQNLGTEIKYKEKGDPLPLTIRLGSAYKRKFMQDHCIQGAIDIIKSIDSQIKENIGVEYIFKDVLAGRIGTRLGYDIGLLTCGMGLYIDKVKLDYAWTGGGNWDNQHWISLSFYFSQDLIKKAKKKEEEMLMEEIRRGMKFFQNKKWQKGMKVWKGILEKRPRHKIASGYLKKTKEKLDQLIEKFYNEGKQCYKNNQWLKAVQNWKEALKLSYEKKESGENEIKRKIESLMKELKVIFELGENFYNDGSYGEALKKWQEVADKYPGYLNTREKIEDVHVKIKEMAERKQEKIIESIIEEGKQYFEENKYLEAVERWRQALRLNPEKKEASICIDMLIRKYFKEGQILYKEGKFKKAFEQWEKINKVDLEYYKGNKKWIKNAKKDFEEKVEMAYKKGVKKYSDGNYLDAIEWWEKGLHWMPEHQKMKELFIEANLAQGILSYREHKLKEALKYWEKFLKLKPKHDRVLMYMKRAKTKQERLKKLK